MSRRDLHNDENFWPCVSDMFLALFVIALVLYSTMSADKGRGDKYVSALAAQEACELFVKLQEKYPDSEPIKSINVDEILDEDPGARPKLAEALYSLLSCKETAQFFHVTDETLAKIPDDAAMYRYSDAIALLYEARTAGGAPPDENDPCYHVHMRKVREYVELEIYKSESGSKYSDLSREELLAIIKEREQQISEMVSKEIYAALEKQYQDLLDNAQEAKDLIDDVNDLEYEIQLLTSELEALKENIGEQKGVIAGQNKKIAELQDTRVHVMAQVQNVLDKDTYKPLRDAGVEVKAEHGIVIIPSSVFSFPTATSDYYSIKSVIKTGNVEDRLQLSDKDKNNLALLAQFLDEIAEMVVEGKLAVDSISIECHTDTDLGNITTERTYYNDGLSLQRAFDVWRLLNKYVDRVKKKGSPNLSERVKDGQRIFTMSGFGMRVSPERKLHEEKPAYDKRCRRMQLRFNCNPKKSGNKSSSLTPEASDGRA